MQLIIIDALEKKLVSLTQAGKITVIIPVAVRETVSLGIMGDQLMTPPETSQNITPLSY